jgi:hypothetical protein
MSSLRVKPRKVKAAKNVVDEVERANRRGSAPLWKVAIEFLRTSVVALLGRPHGGLERRDAKAKRRTGCNALMGKVGSQGVVRLPQAP